MIEPEKDDIIRSAEQLREIFPDLPIFEVSEMPQINWEEFRKEKEDETK